MSQWQLVIFLMEMPLTPRQEEDRIDFVQLAMDDPDVDHVMDLVLQHFFGAAPDPQVAQRCRELPRPKIVIPASNEVW